MSEQRKYWVVPRQFFPRDTLIEDGGLLNFLRSLGYEVRELPQSRIEKESLSLGTFQGIPKHKKDRPIFSLKYDPEHSFQIQEALKLRALLQANNIRFEEKPSIAEVKKSLSRAYHNLMELLKE
jgi:hypothetical protein